MVPRVPPAPRLGPELDPAFSLPFLELPRPVVLSVDHRERGLIAALADVQCDVKTLAVGDLMCEYDNGIMWIAERKCANDLAKVIVFCSS